VYDKKDLLDQVFVVLRQFDYDVRMSYKGTIPVSWNKSAFRNCEDAVDHADLFLGIISPCYGSGVEAESGLSITEKEMRRARDRRIPRIMLVDERVMFLRRYLMALGFKGKEGRARFVRMLDEAFPERIQAMSHTYLSARSVCDLRTLDLYDEMVLGLPNDQDTPLEERAGNWIQECNDLDDYKRFIISQFSFLQRPEVYSGTAEAISRVREKLDPKNYGASAGGAK